MPWTLFLDGVHCWYVLTDQYDEDEEDEEDEEEEEEDNDDGGCYSFSAGSPRHDLQAACPPTDDQPQLSFSKKSKK